MKIFQSTAILTLVLVCLTFAVNAGQIFPHDIVMSPNNRGTASQFTLTFTLDSPLSSTDYLRIIFPFALSSLQAGVWDTYTGCTIIGPGKQAIVTASTITGDTNAFFVQFYTDLTTAALASLSPNVTYYLKFTAIPSSVATQGINFPIQVYSVSNNAANWITYDANPVFGTVSVAAAYTSTMTVTSSIASTVTDKNTVGASYIVSIDFTPKTTINNQARIDIQLINTQFSLLNCQSVASTADKITALTTTFQPLASNIIRATVLSTVVAGNSSKYRFQCMVQNPLTTQTSLITVQTRMGYEETIIDSGTDSTGLTSTAATFVAPSWDESAHQILLGWGYDASSPTALKIFSLYEDYGSERWYQSVKFIFKPNADLTVIDMLQVVISTVNDAAFTVLQASIYHNLPDYSSSAQVSCSVITQGYFTCKNVGQLQNQAYYVSFRFNLASSNAATTAPNFGKVQVQTQASTPVTLMAMSSTTLTNTAITTNPALYWSNGIIASSVIKSSSTAVSAGVANGADIQLKFSFSYFAGLGFYPLSGLVDKGIELYTSPQLASSSSPTCSFARFASTDATITDCGVDQMDSYTRLRFRIALLNNQGTYSPPWYTFYGYGYDSIIFDPVNFASDQFSSLNYVNENVFDYYARWVTGFTQSNPAITQQSGTTSFFFNSVVFQYGALSNVYVSSVFHYSGINYYDTVNDGSVFPTVLRITGYLTPSEQTTADRLLLFFHDFVPFDTVNPCFGPTGISCKYIAGTTALNNAQTDGRTDYSGSRRIEITLDLTQKFNIYIPVSVPLYLRQCGYYLATASEIDSRASTLGIFETQYTKRYNYVYMYGYYYYIDNLYSSSPRINLASAPSVGATLDTYIGNIVSGNYVVGTNSGSTIGAHYGYCADYDFTLATNFAFQPFYFNSVATPDQYCSSVKYTTAAGKNMYCHICPIHKSMPYANIALTQFTLPTKTGRDFSSLAYIVSDTAGGFQRAGLDQQAGVLTASVLSAHSLTFTPTAFKKGSKNVFVRLSFTLASTLPQTIRLDILPTGSSSSLYMIPTTTATTCTVNTITTTSCAISGSTSDIQMTISAQDSYWPKTTHTIDFMVDAAGASGLSADTTVNYKVTIRVTGYSANVLHHDSSAQTYIVQSAASLNIALTNSNYLFGNQGARTILTFDFEIPSDILAYSSQSLVVNLGGVATANSGVVPLCQIKNAVTQVMSNDFTKCDVSNLAQIALQPKGPINGKYTMKLTYLTVPSTASPTGITVQLLGLGGSIVVAQSSSALAYPTAPAGTSMPTANVAFDRLYSDPGEVGEITITIKSSVQPITNTTYMYVHFPSYYSEKLGYENIVCSAGGLSLSCFLIESRVIQLTNFPQTVAIGTSVKVKIYGVITPVVPGTVGKIFIGLAVTDSPFTLTEQILVSDKASVATLPGALAIQGLSVSNNVIRTLADYTITMTTDSTGIRSGKIIAIDFPDSQGSILRNQTAPVIQITKVGNSLVTTVQTKIFGSRLKFTLPLDLNPKTTYTLVIKSLWNPELAICNMDTPTIIVMDTAENAAISRTAPNLWDIVRLSYIQDNTLKTLRWGDNTGTEITSLALTIGVFSPEIWIMPPSGESFMTDITFTNTQSSIFKILPSTMQANRGASYLAIRIAPASTQLPTIVLLTLAKNEGLFGSYYSQLLKLPVTLTTVKVTIPAMTISIMPGATSLPYEWDFDALSIMPHTELKIDVAVTSALTSPLSVLGPTSITFSPDSPKGSFVFALASTANPLSPPSFTLTLSGTDNAYYELESATVTVNVLTAVSVAPTISSAIVASNYAPTRQSFSLTTDQPASVFWHVAYVDQLSTTDCLRIRSNFNEGNVYDETSTNQAQYGVFYIPVENVATVYEIDNLMSNEKYSYMLCPTDQLDLMGTPITGTFKTSDNGAALYEVTTGFSSDLTKSQIKALVCLFNQQLQLPDENVVAMDGTTCASSSLFDSFSSFNYSNLTIYVATDRRSDTTSQTGTTLSQYITSVGNRAPSDFLTNFNQVLQTNSLTALYQSIALRNGSTYDNPVVSSTSTVATSVTDTTITISGLELSSGTGVFYAIASDDILNVPNYQQIKNKLNGKDLSVSGANAFYTDSSVSLTLTNVRPSTEYIIYYYASTDDRTGYAKTTDIKYVITETAASRIAIGAPKLEISLIMSLVLGFIGLFF